MKIFKILIALSAFSLMVSGCSVVFTSSITGTIVDEEQYDNGTAGSGISDAEVYLYTDEAAFTDDLSAWSADSSILPDNPPEGEPVYFLKTVTDEQGVYTFNGLIWNELFPDYGKSGDRKEVFMLFYHERYGLQPTSTPVFVVSDVTNRIPLFKLPRILNTANLAGTVKDAKTDLVLPNVNVQIWVPESWSYLTDGSINTAESALTWDTSPSYTALSDENGEWSQEISYKMLPSSTDNRGTTILRLTWAATGYLAENASDSRITDGGWDMDGNGSIDPDEAEGFLQSTEVEDDTYADLGTVSLADEYNTAVLTGKLSNSNTNSGEPAVTVDIFIAEDWSYNSTDPEDIEAPSSVDWPENPSYTTTTDADGLYNQDVRFERKPSEADNRGTTRARLVFTKDTFVIDSSTDAKLTDGGWDRDGSGSIDADEDDSFYDPAVVTKDITNDLGTIVVKQTKFTETVSGQVETAGVGQNGVEVWLFFDPVWDPGTDKMETAAPAGDEVDAPDYSDTTEFMLVSQDTIEDGHFSFNNLEWTDINYTGNQSRASCYLYLPTPAEIDLGLYKVAEVPDPVKFYITAGSSNNVSLEK